MGSRLCDLGAARAPRSRAAPKRSGSIRVRIAAGHLERSESAGRARPIRAARRAAARLREAQAQLADRGLRRPLLRLRLAARHRRDRGGARRGDPRRRQAAVAGRPQHGRSGGARRDRSACRSGWSSACHARDPERGAFAPVLALRGTYPFVRRLSRLDLEHSPEDLAARVFSTFPGLYQLLPAGAATRARSICSIPRPGRRRARSPSAALLARVARSSRAGMADAG